LDVARELALNLAGDLARDLDVARELALNLARDLDRARDLACDLARDLARDLAHARDHNHDLASDLDRAHALASALAGSIVDLDHGAPRARAVVACARSMPGQVSRGLVALAVLMLPVAQRSRYRAEFHVELVDLPRRERWGYALRVLASSWELRLALIEAVCSPDGATARRAER
ncbi:MAG: hypothetical protein ACRDTD_29825, partial [Pseudonocardiaceae bacterium]